MAYEMDSRSQERRTIPKDIAADADTLNLRAWLVPSAPRMEMSTSQKAALDQAATMCCNIAT
jgi:hypothetical protein